MYDIGSAIISACIVCAVGGAIAATALIYGVPWLWAAIKPTLRALVA